MREIGEEEQSDLFLLADPFYHYSDKGCTHGRAW